MKTLIFTVLIVLSSVTIAFSSSDDVGCSYRSEYNGKKYESVMPVSTISKSPDLDLTKSELPVPLSRIIDVAYSQLIKITGTKEGWQVSTITFNNWGEKQEKWFYAVGFSTNDFKQFAHISILVTVDGQLGLVKEVSEKVLK